MDAPLIQRVIVTVGGASIFFDSLFKILTSLLDIGVSAWIAAIVSFALGAAVAAWVLYGRPD